MLIYVSIDSKQSNKQLNSQKMLRQKKTHKSNELT